MGNRVAKFEFIPGENEEIEANIVVPKETRSIIHGVVRYPDGQSIRAAIVRLFEFNFKNKQSICSVANTVTDDDGEFVFGPLCSKKHYMIKVWVNSNKIKEMIITPDEITSHKDIEVETKITHKNGSKPDFYIDELNFDDDIDEENQ